jgi:hypothetical protein
MRRSLVIDAGLDKLQQFLLEMAPGDQVSAKGAADLSGLDERRCDVVLSALVHAGLMIRLQHDAYVRCRLQMQEQPPAR